MRCGLNITAETREGDATVLTFTTSYNDEKSGAQRRRFHYMGVTKDMVIVAPRRATLREALARLSAQQGPAAGSLASDPAFLRTRSRLPNNLSALTYSDLANFPWQLIADGFITGYSQDDKSQKEGEKEGEKLTPQQQEAIRSFPKIITRYLKLAFGGSWKDRNGVFVESYIE